MDNENKKIGFSGISDLTSEVNINKNIVEPKESEIQKQSSYVKASPSKPKAPTQKKSETQSKRPHQSVQKVRSKKSFGSDGGKWVLGIIGLIIFLGLMNAGDKVSKRPKDTASNIQTLSTGYDYRQKSSGQNVQSTNKNSNVRPKYQKPPVGTNRVLSRAQICWCLKEDLRIETMRNVIKSIDGFNLIVSDYNKRCGIFKYNQGSLTWAKRQVEADRSQIVSQAIQYAKQLDMSEQLHKKIVKKLNNQDIKVAQQLLTDLGYKPGPIDGLYGRETADAIKGFQRDIDLTQDGEVNKDLLNLLKKAKEIVGE